LLKGLCHEQLESNPMPSSTVLEEVITLCRSVLFPGYLATPSHNKKQTCRFTLVSSVERLHQVLSCSDSGRIVFHAPTEKCVRWSRECSGNAIKPQNNIGKSEKKMAQSFCWHSLLRCRKFAWSLATDVEGNIQWRSGLAHDFDESDLLLSGIGPSVPIDLSHKLLELDVPMIPRMITEMAHSETGIRHSLGSLVIGDYFALDHGNWCQSLVHLRDVAHCQTLFKVSHSGAKSFRWMKQDIPSGHSRVTPIFKR